MERKPWSSSGATDTETPVQPDGLLLLRAVIRKGRNDQIVEQLRAVGNDIRLVSELGKPFVNGRPVLRDLTAGDVMIPEQIATCVTPAIWRSRCETSLACASLGAPENMSRKSPAIAIRSKLRA
jgi:hypothetical protein